MCGRFVLKALPEEVQALFETVDADMEPFPPRYNIAPTQPIVVVRQEQGARRTALVRWGLVPPFVKDPRSFSLIINARSEGIMERNAYKNAMRRRRCLVPASGFYEWQAPPGGGRGRGAKQPYWIHPAGEPLLAFAGIWETWSDRDGGEIDSGCIVTTAANSLLAPIHGRMPVIVPRAAFTTWLTGDLDDALALLKPAPSEGLVAVPVSDRVNKADNDDPGLIEPVRPMKSDLFQ